jgi:hypothetical protein
MGIARQYTIAGTATLTIRLMKGEHTLTGNVDLYHPQGANLIIEGDPAEFKQRTIWQVSSYTWNLANFAGGGHTASIRVFDGSTTGNGVTLHGFTGEDQGCYFAVSNGAFGSRSGYATNGYSGGYGVAAPGASSSYDPIFWGDRFFNHGYSYEDGMGILGIGRILGATTHGETLSVQFNNLNWDCRCPAWHTDGGLANTTTWGGVASNYPETQYSQPVGYYGTTTWKSENGERNYPPKPAAAVHVTTDPYILSSYPVTIRAQYSNNTGSLLLKGGKIRAIRNIMFANSQAPYTLVTGVTGATLNWTQAITAVNTKDINDPHSRFVSNGCGLVLEDSEVGVRHLGFLGTGTAISAFRSKITKYTQNTSNASVAVSGITGSQVYATLNSLDNAPVLCVNQCQNGIIAKNSTVDFTDASGANHLYNTDYSDSSVLISAGRAPVFLSGTDFKTTSLYLEHHHSLPVFQLKVVVPIFPGTTVAGGASAAFNQYAGSTAMWAKYPLIRVVVQTTNGGSQELGFVNYYARETSSIANLSGSTGSATITGGSSTTVEYQKFFFTGLKTMVNSGGLSYMGDYEVINGITATTGGGTLGIYFYSTLTGTTSSAYILDKTSVRVVTESGTTGSITSIPYADSTQFAARFVQSYDSLGNENVSASSFGKPLPYTASLGAYDGSSVGIEKIVWVQNSGDSHAIAVQDQSRMNVGDRMVYSDPSIGDEDWEQSGTVGADHRLGSANNSTGTICITGFPGWNAVSVGSASALQAGVIFAKHPTWSPLANNLFNIGLHSTGWSFPDTVVNAYRQSSVELCGLVCLGNIMRGGVYGAGVGVAGTGLWTSRTGVGFGGKAAYTLINATGFITAQQNSSIFLHGNAKSAGSGNTLGYIFHPDGGNMLSYQRASGDGVVRIPLLTTRHGGYIQCNANHLFDGTNITPPVREIRFTSDNSTGQNQKISTRAVPWDGVSGGVYNTSTTRWWLANVSGASVYGAATGVSNLNTSYFAKSSDALGTYTNTSGFVVSAYDMGGRIEIMQG